MSSVSSSRLSLTCLFHTTWVSDAVTLCDGSLGCTCPTLVPAVLPAEPWDATHDAAVVDWAGGAGECGAVVGEPQGSVMLRATPYPRSSRRAGQRASSAS